MFKFFKKMMLVGLIAGGTIYAVKHTKMGGHVRHEVSEAVAWAESKIPFEKKIEKLRRDVSFLDKDINKVASNLAKEIVETRLLTDEVTTQRASLDKQRATLLARGKSIEESLKVGTTDKAPPAPGAKDQLRAEVASFKTREQQLATSEKALELKEKNKSTLENQLTTLKTKKLELQTAINQAETKFKELQLAQMESKYQSDDTRLARIKADLKELNKQLDIKAVELQLQPRVIEEAPIAPPADNQSVADILAPLNK